MHHHPTLRKDLADELRRGLDERAALMALVPAADGSGTAADARGRRFVSLLRARLGRERYRSSAGTRRITSSSSSGSEGFRPVENG